MIPSLSRARTRWRPFAAVLALVPAALLPASAQFPDTPRAPLPPLADRRAAVLKQFDLNADGRLSDAERESARKAWSKQQLTQRGDRGGFQVPPELLEEFDTDKNGEIDGDEGRVLGETLGPRMEKMSKDYDLNSNGRLDPDEIAAAERDHDAGKLKGIPKMFIRFAAGPPRGGPRGPRGPGGPGGPGGPDGPWEDLDPQSALRAADVDHDGRLSASELQALRAARALRQGTAPKPTAPPTP